MVIKYRKTIGQLGAALAPTAELTALPRLPRWWGMGSLPSQEPTLALPLPSYLRLPPLSPNLQHQCMQNFSVTGCRF